MDGEADRPSLGEWLWALSRLRVLWPLPALLFLALALSFASEQVWLSTLKGRRQWSPAELAMVTSGLGSLLYWLTMYLSHVGLLHVNSPRFRGREPSPAEVAVFDMGVRALCLLMTYAGPAVILFAP